MPDPNHAVRRTAITNVYRASRDLFLAQRFARHADPFGVATMGAGPVVRPAPGVSRKAYNHFALE